MRIDAQFSRRARLRHAGVGASVIDHGIAIMAVEACPSGRRERTANALRGVKPLPGFKSPRLRQALESLIDNAPVAQWIRASGYGPEGRGFESLRAYSTNGTNRVREAVV
jgi:hypothetical protein